jgi:predicted HAD superfamily hydrolase
MLAAGKKEISLEGIYSCFGRLPVPALDIMRAEYDLELTLVHPNAELIHLFNETVTSGKPVVITSDTYLPEDFFKDAFHRHQLALVPFFISAARNATKRDHGDLFDIVSDELGLPRDRILHVGDNPISDVERAKAKGLTTFHYRESRRPPVLQRYSEAASLARGLIRTHTTQIKPDSYQELGFLYGGPAAVGFLDWITELAQRDGIDHVLFLARDGYVLNRLAKTEIGAGLPKCSYFLGSRTACMLAAINDANFVQYLPFLLSGADGLSPFELLDRIGVPVPADGVMKDLGLGAETIVTPQNQEHLARFLHAYRWEILKICRRNHRALFAYLKQLDIKEGEKVALVDVGWNGTTQEAFKLAIHDFIDIDVFGYYFCLARTPDQTRRQKTQRMAALVSSSSVSGGVIDQIYANRVAVEFFFSAPHNTIIGLAPSKNGVVAVEDPRRPASGTLSQNITEIVSGVELFSQSYEQMRKRTGLRTSPIDVVWPLIEFSTSDWNSNKLLSSVQNFDAWASSYNRNVGLAEYKPRTIET